MRVRSERTARSTSRTSSISGTSASGSEGASGQRVTWIDGASSWLAYMYWYSSSVMNGRNGAYRPSSVRKVSHNVDRADAALLVRVAVLGPEPVLDELDVVVAEFGPEELVERFTRDRVVVRLEARARPRGAGAAAG